MGLDSESGANGVGVKQVLPPLADHGALPLPTTIRHHRDINPTPDGGLEITSASWFHPGDLFLAFRRGQLALFPPQYYLLTTLVDFLDSKYQGSDKAEVLRSRIGAFGARLFNPRPAGFTEEGGKGQRSVLTYEGDELRGGKAGDRHRSLVLYQGRVSGEMLTSTSSSLLY